MTKPGKTQMKHSNNRVEWVMVDDLPFVTLHLQRKDLIASMVLTPREAIDLGSELQRVADEVHCRRADLRKTQ